MQYSAVAPRYPGSHSLGSPAVPDEIPLNSEFFFVPKPNSLPRITRCTGQIPWILAIRGSEMRLYLSGQQSAGHCWSPGHSLGKPP